MLKRSFAAVALLAAAPAWAAGPQLSGYLNTAYVHNTRAVGSQTNALRSHDNRADSLQLNTLYLKVDGETGDGLNYHVATDIGANAAVHRSADPRGGNAADQFDIQEAYFTYALPHRLTAKAGKFATWMGIEVMKSPDNPTMTRGFLFGLAEPYTHSGAVLTYDLPAVVQLGAGVVNGWDVLTDNNRGKTGVWRVGIDLGPRFNGSFNGSVGPEKNGNGKDLRTSYDATFYSKLYDALTLAYQAHYGREVRLVDRDGDGTNESAADWWGFTVQPLWTLMDGRYGLGLRYEYFQDDEGVRAGAGVRSVYQNVAVAPAWSPAKSLTLRAEYRYDWSARRGGPATTQAFESASGRFDRRNQTTLGLEAIYKFGS